MKVLLTSAGFSNKNIGDKFLNLLDKPVCETKVLFIPTAAVSKEAKFYVDKCKDELLESGIKKSNILIYDFEYKMTIDEALSYDVIYFTGGETSHLLTIIRRNKFDSIIDSMISKNKIYVGVSAGSIIMTPNISLDDAKNIKTEGLGYLQAYLLVHYNQPNESWMNKFKNNFSFPFIAIIYIQDIIINENGFKVIE
jgi:peptidase E